MLRIPTLIFILLATALGGAVGAATRTAASFGALGGAKPAANATAAQIRAAIPDDSAALQAMLDAAKPGDVLTFAGTKAYRLGRGLVLTCPDVSVWFNGATLILDTSDWPGNTALTVRSPYVPTPSVEYDGPIDAGWHALPEVRRTGPVWLMLGKDPHDPNEEHFGTLVGPTETRVWVPYDVAGTHHRMFPVARVCERVRVRDLRVSTVPGQVANANVWVEKARHVAINGLRGRVSIGVQLADCEHVELTDVDVDLEYTHQSGGRVLSAWQSRYVTANRIKLRGGQGPTTHAAEGFFFESWCRHVTLDNVDATYGPAPDGWGWIFPTFFITGGCHDISIPHARLTVPAGGSFYPFDRGGLASQEMPRFGALELVGGGSTWVLDWMIPAKAIDVQRVIRQ